MAGRVGVGFCSQPEESGVMVEQLVVVRRFYGKVMARDCTSRMSACYYRLIRDQSVSW